jgi:hypothetical protein
MLALLLATLLSLSLSAPIRLDLSTPSLTPGHTAFFTVSRRDSKDLDRCEVPRLARSVDPPAFSIAQHPDEVSSVVLALVEPKRRFLFFGKEDQVVCYLTGEGHCVTSLADARLISLPVGAGSQVSFEWPILEDYGGVVQACTARDDLKCEGLYFQGIALTMDDDDDDDGAGADLSSKCRSHRDDTVWLAPLATPPEDVCVTMLGALEADHREAEAEGASLEEEDLELEERPSIFTQILNFFGIWTRARPNWDQKLQLQVQTEMLRSVAATLGAERAACLCQIVSTLAEKVFPIFIVPLHQDASVVELLSAAPALMRLGIHATEWDGTVTIDGEVVVGPSEEGEEEEEEGPMELPWIFEWVMDNILCDEFEEGWALMEARQILEDHLMCSADRGNPQITCTLIIEEKTGLQKLAARFLEFVSHRRENGMCTTIGEIAADAVDAALCVRLCVATQSDVTEGRLPEGKCEGGYYGELEALISPAELRLSGAQDGGADEGLSTAAVVGIAAGLALCCCGLLVTVVVVGGLGLRHHKRAAAAAAAPAPPPRRRTRRNSSARYMHASRRPSEQHFSRADF